MVKLSDEILLKIEKPARYTGGEVNDVMKNISEVDIRFALCFPDVYEVGMSHLGIKILYQKINNRKDSWCERVFAPWTDMEKVMRENDIPLFGLESRDELSIFDFVGFTLQYEMSYTNIINMLDLAGIPIMSEKRNETSKMPFVIFGGPCAYNPEPLADIADLFVLGDGEEVIEEILDAYKEWKANGKSRSEFLDIAGNIKGVYVPSHYEVVYNEDGTIKERIAKKDNYPAVITKRFVQNLDEAFYPDKIIVPLTEIVHDRIVLETFRGCTRGCRFCQAGMIYRPIREKSTDTLLKQADELLKNTGYDEISLSSLSICDYSDIKNLIQKAMEKYANKKIGISLPSIRIDSFSVDLINEIQKVRKTGLTFAPEAGSQRMRDIINKGVDEDDLITSVRSAFELGWSTIKLYFMIGLPYETMEDVYGIVELAEKVVATYYSLPKEKRKKGLVVNVSSSSFVPKPFTPFQWECQDRIDVLREKQRNLKSSIKSRAISYSWHESYVSFLEGVFSRGDRRLTNVLVKAWEKGCKFDGWNEYFNYDNWMEAFKECNVDPEYYVYRKRNFEEILPWDFIDIGVTKEYLIRELQNAEKEVLTKDCRLGCTGCGMASLFEEGECISGAFSS
jgi:radical SAM family uncharacterized protein